MWLPETAVDLVTLDLLAEQGIAFTILAPRQARAVRAAGGAAWVDAAKGLDTQVPYRCRLPSGRSIALFFYDGAIARAVAFERLLAGGEGFVDRLLSALGGGAGGGDREGGRLVHVATDGETYGHHHRHGEMALAWALEYLEERGAEHGVALTNYGQFLEGHPPVHEVEIVENTSWSCVHGVERWRGNCGCQAGGEPGWNQGWRRPLRDALDWFCDSIAPRFEEMARTLLADPWAACDDYVAVVLDRLLESVERFFARHQARPLDPAERTRALELLELQRHALLMYTSCGWFFSDLTGIKTVQVLQYAKRAVQLARSQLGLDLEAGFLDHLAAARSNRPEQGDGRAIFDRAVRPAQVELPQVAAHYAVNSLFEDYPPSAPIYCYRVDREAAKTFRTGRARLVAGRLRVSADLTGAATHLTYAVLHFGDQNLNASVRPFAGDAAYEAMVGDAAAAFERGDFAAAVRVLDRHFAGLTYSLRSLFRDEQRKVVKQLLAATLDALEGQYRSIFDHHAPLMRFVDGLGVPLPRSFQAAAELVLNVDLRRAVENGSVDPDQVEQLLAETSSWGLELDSAGLGLAFARAIEAMAERLRESPDDLDLLRRLDRTAALARSLPFRVELWEVQNTFHHLLETAYPERAARAAAGDAAAAAWVGGIRELGKKLQVQVG